MKCFSLKIEPKNIKLKIWYCANDKLWKCAKPFNSFGFDWKSHGLTGSGNTPILAYKDYLSWKEAVSIVSDIY